MKQDFIVKVGKAYLTRKNLLTIITACDQLAEVFADVEGERKRFDAAIEAKRNVELVLMERERLRKEGRVTSNDGLN